jgi:hypothetical protein
MSTNSNFDVPINYFMCMMSIQWHVTELLCTYYNTVVLYCFVRYTNTHE